MTFDHEQRIWIKQNLKKIMQSPPPTQSPAPKLGRPAASDADPFEGIPDLSIDELKEASWKKSSYRGQRWGKVLAKNIQVSQFHWW